MNETETKGKTHVLLLAALVTLALLESNPVVVGDAVTELVTEVGRASVAFGNAVSDTVGIEVVVTNPVTVVRFDKGSDVVVTSLVELETRVGSEVEIKVGIEVEIEVGRAVTFDNTVGVDKISEVTVGMTEEAIVGRAVGIETGRVELGVAVADEIDASILETILERMLEMTLGAKPVDTAVVD